MKFSPILIILLAVLSLSLSACNMHEEQPRQEPPQIVVTTPVEMDVTITQPYVCQIHSRNHIEVQALQDGYLDQVLVTEGQRVTKGQVMFKILPTLYKARFEAEKARAKLAFIKWDNTNKLYLNKRSDGSALAVVSDQEVAKAEAEMNEANAKRDLAEAELNFTEVTAKFDGIVDRLYRQQGSLIEKRDILTTLSDNSLMWVYFNVPEARYLDYMASRPKKGQSTRLELRGLADRTRAGERQHVQARRRQHGHRRGQVQQRERKHPLPRGLSRTQKACCGTVRLAPS